MCGDCAGSPPQDGEIIPSAPILPVLRGRPKGHEILTAAERRERRRACQRASYHRHHSRELEALWQERVRQCGGAGACPWAGRGTGDKTCRCVAGQPCACEREVWTTLHQEGEREYGPLTGPLLGDAVMGLLRAKIEGREHEVLRERIVLVKILLEDRWRTKDLEIRANRKRDKLRERDVAVRERRVTLLEQVWAAAGKPGESHEETLARVLAEVRRTTAKGQGEFRTTLPAAASEAPGTTPEPSDCAKSTEGTKECEIGLYGKEGGDVIHARGSDGDPGKGEDHP
jgi:hypothetical protein